MKTLPYTPEAYQLLQEGAVALAKVESVGMRVDEAYIASALEKTRNKIAKKERKLQDSKVMRRWRNHFKSRTNFNSNEQLGKVLFDDMDYKCPATTETGRYKTDEETLNLIDEPFVVDWVLIKKLHKAIDYLQGIQRETCGGLLHPVFNLHIARTFRSSSDSPNFQNIPVRLPWMAELIRRSIIARPGRRLVEMDYKGIEVCGAYCYHKDSNMRKYLLDKTKDMHRDMAMEIYKLPQEEVTKQTRYSAKNGFVFPEFYGAWWMDCAAALWHNIETLKLTTVTGTPLREHLKSVGIRKLGAQNRETSKPTPGSFEEHIQRIEKRFWEKRFPTYSMWKRKWYEAYLKKGWFRTLTGFICQGFMSRNDVINYPVQGASFHCLLWSLIRLVNHELRKNRMKSQVVGQIHDSIVADVVEKELEEYVALAREVMTKKIREAWKWVIIPLEAEVEATPVGGSWVEKEEYRAL